MTPSPSVCSFGWDSLGSETEQKSRFTDLRTVPCRSASHLLLLLAAAVSVVGYDFCDLEHMTFATFRVARVLTPARQPTKCASNRRMDG